MWDWGFIVLEANVLPVVLFLSQPWLCVCVCPRSTMFPVRLNLQLSILCQGWRWRSHSHFKYGKRVYTHVEHLMSLSLFPSSKSMCVILLWFVSFNTPLHLIWHFSLFAFLPFPFFLFWYYTQYTPLSSKNWFSWFPFSLTPFLSLCLGDHVCVTS